MGNSVFENVGILSFETLIMEKAIYYLNQINTQEKQFPEKLIAIEIKKTQIRMLKPVYFELNT